MPDNFGNSLKEIYTEWKENNHLSKEIYSEWKENHHPSKELQEIGLEEEVYKNIIAINDIVDRIVPIKNNDDDASVALLVDAYQDLDNCLQKIKDFNPRTRDIISKRAKREESYSDEIKEQNHETKMRQEIYPLINKLNRIYYQPTNTIENG